MKNVKCPAILRSCLFEIWEDVDSDGPYAVIREVIDSLKCPEEGSAEGEVLYDTLYRYLVLFGIPPEFEDEDYDMPWRHNRVWNCVVDCLRGASSRASNRRKIKTTCEFEYRRDSAIWNFKNGNHERISRYHYDVCHNYHFNVITVLVND